jgi:voltage-gated potassium channel
MQSEQTGPGSPDRAGSKQDGSHGFWTKHPSCREEAAAKFHRSMTQRSEFALKAWNFLDNPESSLAARLYDMATPYFLLGSVVFTLLQTVEPSPLSRTVCRTVDYCIDGIIWIEVLARCCASPKNWRVFFFNPFNLVDILACLPLIFRTLSILEPDFELDQDAFILCLVATIRLIKIVRRFHKIHLLVHAFSLAAEALPVLMFVLAVITLCFSSAIYLVEPRSNIDTLPRSIYFTLVTITSLGYGDITPSSTGGTIIVTILVVSSVLYMAMPFGMIGQAFMKVWEDRDRILLVKKVQDAMLQWGYMPSDMPMLFQAFDSSGEGDLSITDFRKMIHAMRIGLSDDRVCELFHSFDKNSNGYVNDREMVRYVFPMAFHDVYSEMGSESDIQSVSSPLCPKCGTAVLPGMQFCGGCGRKVSSVVWTPADPHVHSNGSELPGVPEQDRPQRQVSSDDKAADEEAGGKIAGFSKSLPY